MFRTQSLIALALSSSGACAPDDNLLDERKARAPMGMVAAGAELLDPAPGAIDVPPNLAAIQIRVPAPLSGELPAAPFLQLRSESGEPPIAVHGMRAFACIGLGRCYRFWLDSAVAPRSAYTVERLDGSLLEYGSPVPGGRVVRVARFSTGDIPDRVPPRIAGFQFEVVAGCVDVRLMVDEPAWGEVILRRHGSEESFSIGGGDLSFHAAARVRSFLTVSESELLLRIADRADNPATTGPNAFRLPPYVASLVITEVLANPAGSEITQEFVELRNVSTEPLSLDGFIIEDATSSDALPPSTLEPGAFALVVPAGYEPANAKGSVPRSGTLIIAVVGRLGRHGLSNTGEALRIRGRQGVIVSRYGGWIDVSADRWDGKSTHRTADDACDHPSTWTRLPSDPTPGW